MPRKVVRLARYWKGADRRQPIGGHEAIEKKVWMERLERKIHRLPPEQRRELAYRFEFLARKIRAELGRTPTLALLALVIFG